MNNSLLALTIALFFATVTFAEAQEPRRTSAEIQSEIDRLQVELQKAKIAEGIPPTLIQPKRPESELKILRQLETPATLTIDETTTFADLFHMLAKDKGIPAILDMRQLIDTGDIRSDSIVNPDGYIKSASIKLKNQLKIILELSDLTYVVKNEMLYITTMEESRKECNMTTKVYYVGDILPLVLVEEESEKGNREETDSGTVVVTTEGNPFGGPFKRSVQYDFPQSTNSLVDVITTCIEPYSWDITVAPHGEGEGQIKIYTPTQSLVIKQTEEVHTKIEELLTMLRKMHTFHQAMVL